MKKEKITVTLDPTLIHTLSQQAEQRNLSRSHLVEEAIRLWQTAQLEHDMQQAYQDMAQDNQAWAKLTLAAGLESWPS